MLKKLKDAELKIKLKKLIFYAQEVKFLKFLISYEKIKINKKRI